MNKAIARYFSWLALRRAKFFLLCYLFVDLYDNAYM